MESPIELKGLYIDENYAFTADCGRGLKIINIDDPSNPVKVGSIGENYIVGSVYKNRHFVYLSMSNEGLLMVDVTDPANPVVIDRLFSNAWVWDIHGIESTLFVIMDGADGVNFRILDVGDPYN